MELSGESATERLLRQMREQDRELEALRGSRSVAGAPGLARTLKATGLPHSVVDELLEQQRRSPASLLAQTARGISGETGELVRAAAGIGSDTVPGRLAGGLPDTAAQTAADLLKSHAPDTGKYAGIIPSGSSASALAPARMPARPGTTVTGTADLGPMVRKARKAMKMNQSEFAAHAGVGRRFLSELESGKPSLEFDKVMACALAAGIDLLARARGS